MHTLTRHILAELAKVFLIGLIGLTMMMIILGAVREAAIQGLPLGQVPRLIPYILPEVLRVAVPMTLLLAITTVYGRMSGCNEVLAIKALGIPPMAILWPTYAVAFLLSLATVWLNDLAVSWGRNGARRVLVEAAEEIAYGMLQAQHSYSTPSLKISVKGVEGRRLLRPTLSLQGGANNLAFFVTAEEAELHADHATGMLTITLRSGTFDAGGIVYEFPDEQTYEIPLSDATRAQDASNAPSWLPLRQIPQQEIEHRAVLHRREQELAARAAYQMLCGDFEGLTGQPWEARARELASLRSHLYRLATEPHRRWSAGFICLCFAWIGAPMAIRLRNRDYLTVFFLCFVPILLVYYPLWAWSVDGAKNGTVPPYAVWTGNVLLLLWGVLLLRKVIRY
jgi:lipopolysaccharide export system permease protein